jgi:thiopurine S-methyltransferase
VSEDWIARWQQGRIGWHESDGNIYLHRHWPKIAAGSTVLVPLCGKSTDLIWLASQGLDVTGVELSEVAVKTFFAENKLEYTQSQIGKLVCYSAVSQPIRIYCGDYFHYEGKPADALYDRGSLSAMPRAERRQYVQHTKSLLSPAAPRMIIALEFDQGAVVGPPFSTMPEELGQYWPDLQCIDSHDDLENCPPKFRAAGLSQMHEVAWLSH